MEKLAGLPRNEVAHTANVNAADPFAAVKFAAIAVPHAPLGIIRKGGDDGDAVAEHGEMLAESGGEWRDGGFFRDVVDAENENAHRDLP